MTFHRLDRRQFRRLAGGAGSGTSSSASSRRPGRPRILSIFSIAKQYASDALPEVTEQLILMGYTGQTGTAGEFAARIKAEINQWAKVIRDSKMQQVE